MTCIHIKEIENCGIDIAQKKIQQIVMHLSRRLPFQNQQPRRKKENIQVQIHRPSGKVGHVAEIGILVLDLGHRGHHDRVGQGHHINHHHQCGSDILTIGDVQVGVQVKVIESAIGAEVMIERLALNGIRAIGADLVGNFSSTNVQAIIHKICVLFNIRV